MAILLIVQVSKRERITPHFKSLNILKLPDLYHLNVATFMYNFLHNNLPECFSDYFLLASAIHDRNTRQKDKFRLPLYKTTIGVNFIKKTGIEIWNNTLENYGFDFPLHRFKQLVMATLLAEY